MDLPVSSYNDPPSSSTRLLNCYIEQGGPQGVGTVLNGFPGISAYKVVGDGPIRACAAQGAVQYVVSKDKFYKIAGGVVSLIGSIAGTKRPQIVSNGIQVCVLIEPRAWVYTIAGGTFFEITDVDFTSRGASSVQFFDNYLSFTEPTSGRWFISDLADADSFDSLLFATAEGSPDNLVGHVVDHRQAVLLGAESFEIWDNAGVTGFPFIRSSNGFGEIGCISGPTAAKVDQSVIWLASDMTVRRLQGVTPVRISNHALEKAIPGYTVASSFGQTFTYAGHVFYVLTFPEATWVYDATTQQWFELQSYQLDNWRVSCSMQDGSVYVGDSQSNKLGKLDTVYDEFGEPLVMSWTYAPILSGDYLAHRKLEIFGKMGVGLLEGQGSDPEIMLEKSDDGGQSFMQLPSRKLGVQGNRTNRAVWHRLGRSRNRVYRPSISDPVERKIILTRLNG